MNYFNISKCVLLTAIVLTLVQTTHQKKHRIIGGRSANVGQLPYSVALLYYGSYFCGGAVVSPAWVITAAHCFTPNTKNLNATLAAVGFVNLDQPGPDLQYSYLANAYNNPGYTSGKNSDDIALLELEKKFVFNEAVQPAKLPTVNEMPTGSAIVSGWGRYSKHSVANSITLQYLETKIIPIAECNKILKQLKEYNSTVTNNHICTLAEMARQTACHGDSGGPLVQKNVLIGVVQGGSPTCGQDLDVASPNIFTRVSDYLPFIKQYVQNIPSKRAHFKLRRH